MDDDKAGDGEKVGGGERPDDVLLDLGPQPAARISWLAIAGVWVGAGVTLITGFGSWPADVTALTSVLATVTTAWTGMTRPTRVTIHRDGQIVLHNRIVTRRFPARALIAVERLDLDGAYVLEWGLEHRRTRVQDYSARLLRTVAQLNPDVALLEMRPAEQRKA